MDPWRKQTRWISISYEIMKYNLHEFKTNLVFSFQVLRRELEKCKVSSFMFWWQISCLLCWMLFFHTWVYCQNTETVVNQPPLLYFIYLLSGLTRCIAIADSAEASGLGRKSPWADIRGIGKLYISTLLLLFFIITNPCGRFESRKSWK